MNPRLFMGMCRWWLLATSHVLPDIGRMPSPARSRWIYSLLIIWMALLPARGDAPVPRSLLEPKDSPEAWNVIRLASQNVDRLFTENRLTEIPVQLSFFAPALRTLMRTAATPEAISAAEQQGKRALGWLGVIARAAEEQNARSAKENYDKLLFLVTDIATHFDPEEVKADIFFCPMHAEFLARDPKTPCAKCAMSLIVRRIPYSFIYAKPGEPSIRLTAIAPAPVEAGKKMELTVRLERADKSPILYEDLMVMHTEPIHLLIEEPGLGDYHHEHPTATKTPGEYRFSFTPRKNAPYRIWADIVPVATGVQELPFTDLPSSVAPVLPNDTATRMESAVDGYRFVLSLGGGDGMPLKSQNARGMTVAITDAAGAPVKVLEPVMNAFAHLVGFYGDRETVVHIHPTGGDVLGDDARGGPALGFVFFPPKPGFIRLYCQVSIAGKMIFAPFNVNVEP